MALSFMVALLDAMVLRYGVGVARAGQIVLCFYDRHAKRPQNKKTRDERERGKVSKGGVDGR